MTEAAARALGASMERYGDLSGFVVNRRTGRLIGGHQRLAHVPADAPVSIFKRYRKPNPQGTVALGWIEVGDELWPYRLVDVDARAEREMNLAANAHAAAWDQEALAGHLRALRQQGAALDVVGFDERSLRAVLGAPAIPEEDPSGMPSPPKRPRTKEGELVELGPHRLLCGDAFEPTTLERLLEGSPAACLLTDPPFAIYGSSTGVSAEVTDDKIVRPFFAQLFRVAAGACKRFAHLYVHCDWRSYPAIFEAATRASLAPLNLLVWDKGGSGMGSYYANTHELVALFGIHPAGTTMRGNAPKGRRTINAPNVLRHNRPAGTERLHNAAKPVPLLREFLRHSTDPDDVVLDLFAGSGSTLIACELEGRRCAAVELEPKWCDVIRERYARTVQADA